MAACLLAADLQFFHVFLLFVTFHLSNFFLKKKDQMLKYQINAPEKNQLCDMLEVGSICRLTAKIVDP